ncbi:MAG: glycosyltransferase [Acetobacteraceae bacterium]|nr:glycosyltransferase [Acetobacteraceae bacterium]
MGEEPSAEWHALRAELRRQNARCAQLETELRIILSSTSWRLTRPLRSLVERQRTLVRLGRGLAAQIRTLTSARSGSNAVPPLSRLAQPRWPAKRPNMADQYAAAASASIVSFVYDVVHEVSEAPQADGSPRSCGSTPFPGRVTTIRPGSDRQIAEAWWAAVLAARQDRRHLLVLRGSISVAGILPLLLAELDADPMLGTAQPRFADAASGGLWELPPIAETAGQISPLALPHLPETVITTEILSACVLIRREVVAAMESPDDMCTLAGAVSRELSRARRRGFRNVVVNRAIVPCPLTYGELYPAVAPADAAVLGRAFPDRTLAAEENRTSIAREFETLLGAAYPGPQAPRRLLLDCTGLSPIHNGTSQCLLGFLDGFASLAPDWAIHVHSTAEAASFHRLSTRYPGFVLHSGTITGTYAGALLLNQPWTVEHLARLHRHALVVGCNILDTISWDILYVGPHHLDRTWRFAARHVDILTFISAFSRERFRRRFRLAPSVMDGVVHLSLAAEEQRIAQCLGRPTGEHVLLVGNAYAHKGLEPAVRLLAAALPDQRFLVLGGGAAPGSNVQVIPSGGLGSEEVHGLVATARAIVFPSFYEGFGLPVVEGLAYGRPVLVRRSKLWAEIAAHTRLDGHLVEFDDDPSLIEALRMLLKGESVAGLPFGTGLPAGQEPFRWRDAAAALLRLVEDRLANPDTAHWEARAESVRLLGA